MLLNRPPGSSPLFRSTRHEYWVLIHCTHQRPKPYLGNECESNVPHVMSLFKRSHEHRVLKLMVCILVAALSRLRGFGSVQHYWEKRGFMRIFGSTARAVDLLLRTPDSGNAPSLSQWLFDWDKEEVALPLRLWRTGPFVLGGEAAQK